MEAVRYASGYILLSSQLAEEARDWQESFIEYQRQAVLDETHGPRFGPGRDELRATERREQFRRNLKGHPCGRFVRAS